MTRTYAVNASRTGDWWTLDVPAIGHATQARRLDQAERMARDLVALVEDISGDRFGVEVQVESESLPSVLGEARKAREAAAQSQERAARATRAAVIELRERGLPMRDIGSLLGMTHQRVSQLVATEAKASRETR